MPPLVWIVVLEVDVSALPLTLGRGNCFKVNSTENTIVYIFYAKDNTLCKV